MNTPSVETGNMSDGGTPTGVMNAQASPRDMELGAMQSELRRLRAANIALRRYKSTVKKERKQETDQATIMMADLEAKECVAAKVAPAPACPNVWGTLHGWQRSITQLFLG
jgi:hypothetical protein